MGTAATMADETEEDEEKSLVRWGKIIRKWSPSLKTIGKIIYNEKNMILIFQRRKCCHLWCWEAFSSILCWLPSSFLMCNLLLTYPLCAADFPCMPNCMYALPKNKTGFIWESFLKCGWVGWLIPKQAPNHSKPPKFTL